MDFSNVSLDKLKSYLLQAEVNKCVADVRVTEAFRGQEIAKRELEACQKEMRKRISEKEVV